MYNERLTRNKFTNFLQKCSVFYYKNFSEVVFVHAPKSGGSSIHRMLGNPFINHFTYAELLCRIPNLNRKIVFGVSRNPYDRALSLYQYSNKIGSFSEKIGINATLEDDFYVWLDYIYSNDLQFKQRFLFSQAKFFNYRCKSSVDFIVKFDEINTIPFLLKNITGKDLKLPHIKQNIQRDDKNLSKTERKLIEKIWQEDIESFGG